MKTLVIVTIMMLGTTVFSQEIDLPPNPEPGKCYVRCLHKKQQKKKTKWTELNCALVQFQSLEVQLENPTSRISKDDLKVIDKELVPFIKKGYKLQMRSHYVSNKPDSIDVNISSQRAIAIGNYLVEKGMNPELLVVNSLGSSKSDKTMLEYRIINTPLE
ncbi:hypothetical protein [Dokdonia sp.]|uniref:hypothetical protein n=1 Tax=Dokdonia sp. TaxID=2024995 RepID=UPI0032643270